jgi:CTP synthase
MVQLYPIEHIALRKEEILEHHKYCRIASVDSPFREQIVWAHMINACRPGMPSRDMTLWAKELILP